MSKGDEEKTEAPTPKRKKDARKEGQIAKSTELGTWLQVLVATTAVQLTGARAYAGLKDIRTDIAAIAQQPDPLVAVGILGRGLALVMTTVVPFGVAMVLVGVVALVTQTGFVLATKAAKPSFSKVNPLKGIKRFVSPAGYWQAFKSILKLVAITMVAWSPVLDTTKQLIDSGTMSIFGIAGEVLRSTMAVARSVAMVGLGLAIADYAFQKWQTTKKMKMSKKEIREESKSAEGNPELKGQIRRRQQEMTRNRMLSGVADASVVIVNPTHIAVAVRYEAGTGAPTVVAKGRGLVADRIRAEATEHFIPIVRDIALARTLEKTCKVGQSIPADLYEAVARLLAFVMQVGKRASLLGGVLENPNRTALPVPESVLDRV